MVALKHTVLHEGSLHGAGTEYAAHLKGVPAEFWDGDKPESAPDESWTVEQLKEHADFHGIDLQGASKKDDILARING